MFSKKMVNIIWDCVSQQADEAHDAFDPDFLEDCPYTEEELNATLDQVHLVAVLLGVEGATR